MDAAIEIPVASIASTIDTIFNIAPAPVQPIVNLIGFPVKLGLKTVPLTVQSVHKPTHRLVRDTIFQTVKSVASCFS